MAASDKLEAKDKAQPEKKSNHSGIPEAPFVEDVNLFMKQTENGENAEKVLQRLDEQHSKYKFMELNLVQRKRRLRTQVPDMKSSLEVVKHLKSKQGTTDPIDTHFMLSEQVYAKGTVPPTEKVCLWLGANVMLEYTLDGADELLSKNLQTANNNLIQIEEDLDFLRDQFTTIEVNMARVYNWDVKRRQAAKSS